MKRLRVSVPVNPMGALAVPLFEWMAALWSHKRENWHIVTHVDTGRPVVHSRNHAVKRALESDMDVWFSVDSDQVPKVSDDDTLGGIDMLLDAIERDDVDVVCPITVRKTDTGVEPVIQEMVNPVESRLYEAILKKPRGLHSLGNRGVMGGAGIMVKRHVLEHFYEEGIPWFWDVFVERPGIKYDEQTGRDLFGERLLGHDIWFFMKCHELGFRCWVDTRVFWGHIKNRDIGQEFRNQLNLCADLVKANRMVRQLRKELEGKSLVERELDLLKNGR